jgi:YgiT-type zinc finger domain-containing protein
VVSRLPNEEDGMTCVICRQGEAWPGGVTVVLQRGESTVVVKGVPADVCDNCGEYYLSEETTRPVLARAEAAVANGAKVVILRYAA